MLCIKYISNKNILCSTRKYSHYFEITLNGVICKNIESLWCIPENNIILYNNYTSIKKKVQYYGLYFFNRKHEMEINII